MKPNILHTEILTYTETIFTFSYFCFFSFFKIIKDTLWNDWQTIEEKSCEHKYGNKILLSSINVLC